MCLQDLRISRRLSVRRVPVDTGSPIAATSIDLTNVAMVICDQNQGVTRLQAVPDASVASTVPADRELSNEDGTYLVYTRESMGGYANGRAWVYTEAFGGTTIVVHEYDADTMHEIYGPLKG